MRRHQIAKHNPYFTYYKLSKKTVFKPCSISKKRRQKNIYISSTDLPLSTRWTYGMNMANHASASERKIIRNRGSCQRVKDLLKKLCFSKYINFSTIRNNRRSRRVFLCFYSAIFLLTSAKFQTFAYNSRTVGSSCMNFDSSLRLMSYKFVPNFEAIDLVTFVLEPENRPASLA